MRPRLPGGHERGDGPLLGRGVHPVANQGGGEQRLQTGGVTDRPLDGNGDAHSPLGPLGPLEPLGTTLRAGPPAAGPPAVALPFTHVRFRPCSIVSGLSDLPGLPGSVHRPSRPGIRGATLAAPPPTSGEPVPAPAHGYGPSARPVQPPVRPCRPV
ncbi:hypothetical protein AB0H30_14640 [Streptomyces pseudogriseolus]|uniref:hypothetical protein n=1 Tax=Streptomyces pseudogriseolus TaxID=36817 RepID=UPI00346DFFD5